MRQETGSNPQTSQNKISVRLTANGDLFVLEDFISMLPSQVAQGGMLQIELLTKRMMLVPTDMFDNTASGEAAQIAKQEFENMGVSIYQDEQIVRLKQGSVTALVVVPKSLTQIVDERFDGSMVSYDVPLLRGAATAAEEHLLVDSCDGLTTIKHFALSGDDGAVELRFADVYETTTDASTIYWVERVAQTLNLRRDTSLYIYRCSGTVRRLLHRNFNKIMVCEE